VATSGGTICGGKSATRGFSGIVKETIGSVEQALSNSISATLRKLNWFFIKNWLKLYFVNRQQALKYVGNIPGNRCGSNVARHYHMVDFTPQKRYQEKRLISNIMASDF
jgi:hypothetical protein